MADLDVPQLQKTASQIPIRSTAEVECNILCLFWLEIALLF